MYSSGELKYVPALCEVLCVHVSVLTLSRTSCAAHVSCGARGRSGWKGARWSGILAVWNVEGDYSSLYCCRSSACAWLFLSFTCT